MGTMYLLTFACVLPSPWALSLVFPHRDRLANEAGMSRNATGENMCIDGKLVSELYVLGTKNSATSSLYMDLKPRGIKNMPDDGESKEWPFFLGGGNCTRELWLRKHKKCPPTPAHMVDWSVVNLFTVPMPPDLTHSVIYGFPRKDGPVSEVLTVPHSTFSWNTPALLAQFYGGSAQKLRFVVLLREPLARAQSEWYHTHKLKNCLGCMARDNFVDALEFTAQLALQSPPEITDLLWKSMYARHIEGWLKHFPAPKFTFIPYRYYTDVYTRDVAQLFIKQLGMHHVSPWTKAGHENFHLKPALLVELPMKHTARALFSKFMSPENARLVDVLQRCGKDGGHLFKLEGGPVKEWLERGW